MTREALYALVWEQPVTKVAKAFGISDVALRKICRKHDIPTPPIGYWARLAHGKKVNRIPLPAASSSGDVPLSIRPPTIMASVKATTAAVPIVVPTERPTKLHPIADRMRKAIHSAAKDFEGFASCEGAGVLKVKIAKALLDRVVRIAHALFSAFDQEGFGMADGKDGVHVTVDGEPFVIRIYETRDQKPHNPTRDELKAQAYREESRARYPDLYSPDSKAYRSWDYSPSGRLAIEITDPTQFSWRSENLIGRWHDRHMKKLEDYLGEVMAALPVAAVRVKQRRAEEVERARIEAEEEDRRRRERARQERILKWRDFLLNKADKFHQFERLRTFAQHLQLQVVISGTEPIDRLARVLESIIEDMGQQFDATHLNSEITKMGLFAEDDEPDPTS